MIKMKALRSGNMGPGATKVRRGREFPVESEGRADELEGQGLAHRVEVRAESAPLNKMEPAPANKAAETGPLATVGGETGGETPAPSSPPDQAPRRRRSKRSKDV